MFYLSIFGSVVFVYTLHHKKKKKNNQCTLKRGHFKRKVIFHPLCFRGHVSFPWSKLPSLPLFAQLACVWFFFINVSLEGMILLGQKGSQQNVFVSFHSSLAGFALSSLLFGLCHSIVGLQIIWCFVSKVFLWCSYIHLAKPLYRRRHLPGVLNILVPVQRQFG